jgi:hypothetical protein
MKPTPLQARALRLLVTDRLAGLLLYGRGHISPEIELHWDAPDYRQRREAFDLAIKAADLRRLRRASVEAMERAGWLARIDPDTGRARMVLLEAGRRIVELLGPEDFKDRTRPKAELLSMDLVFGALRDRWHREDGWVWFQEFSPGVNGRRVDALAINRWGNRRGYERMAFEVKRTRGDFLGELRQPEKRQEAGQVADRFWFVTPAGMVQPEEVPGDCGLIWVDRDGHISIKRKAPKLPEPAPTDRHLLGAILTYIIDRPGQQEWRKAMKDL